MLGRTRAAVASGLVGSAHRRGVPAAWDGRAAADFNRGGSGASAPRAFSAGTLAPARSGPCALSSSSDGMDGGALAPGSVAIHRAPVRLRFSRAQPHGDREPSWRSAVLPQHLAAKSVRLAGGGGGGVDDLRDSSLERRAIAPCILAQPRCADAAHWHLGGAHAADSHAHADEIILVPQ